MVRTALFSGSQKFHSGSPITQITYSTIEFQVADPGSVDDFLRYSKGK